MINCHPLRPDEYSISATTRSFRLRWNIRSDSPLTPELLEQAQNVPSVGDRCPYVQSLFAQSVAFRTETDAYHWIADVQYGPRTIEGDYHREQPWTQPPEIRNTTEFENATQDYEYVAPYEKEEIGSDGEPFTRIKYTQPLLNVLGELYNPAPTRRVAVEIKQIRWWTRSWKDEWSVNFRNTLNYTPVYLDGISYAPLSLWCTQLQYNRHYYGRNNAYCFQIDAEFRYHEEGWRYKPIQASYHAKNPATGKIEDVYEKDGLLYYASEPPPASASKIAEPALLNESGGLLVKDKKLIPQNLDNIRYGNHRLLGAKDWAGLNIPTLKAIHV